MKVSAIPPDDQPAHQFGAFAEIRMAVLINNRPDARRGGTADLGGRGAERRSEAERLATLPASRARNARSSLEGNLNISAICPTRCVSSTGERYFKYGLSFC